MGKAVRGFILTILLVCTVQGQEAVYPDAVIADHQVGLFTNRQAWPPQLLQSTISPTALSLSVGTSAGLVTPGVVQIRDEIIKVSSESSGTITVWSVSGITVNDCTNAAPIVVTTATDHNLTGAERVTISGVGGNTACNVSNAAITRLGGTTFSIDGSTGSGAFSSSGSLSANGRGYDGTTAATHLAGSTVTANVVSAQLTQLFREIEALETAGPAGGGVAGSPNDIQLNIGGSHGVFTNFTYNGEFLYIPRSATTPATKGGALVLEEPTGGVGGGGAGINMDLDTVTGFRIYSVFDADMRMGYFNFFTGRDLDVEYDGRILMHNDRALNMKDSAATDNPVLKLNGSNHFEIGPAAALPGTPDVWFYKDGSVVSKFSTDSSNGEISLIPSTDQDRQVGAYNAMWQRIIGLRMDVGRSTSTTEVQGTLALHTGVSGYSSPTIVKGTTDATQFPFIPVLNAAEFAGSLIPSQNDVYVLGSDGLSGGGTGSVRRWAEAHIKDLYVSSCTGCGTAGLPVPDTTSIVEDNSDPTKEIRFELGGLTSGTTRVLTPQNTNYTLAGLETTQTFSGANTFTSIATFSSAIRSDSTLDIRNSFGTIAAKFESTTANVLDMKDGSGTLISRWSNNFATQTISLGGIKPTVLVLGGSTFPGVTSSYDLGSTSLRWDEVHANKGFFPSGVTAGVTVGSPGCTSGSPASGGDNGRLYWDNGTSTLYVCSNGSPVTVYP